MSVKFKKMMAKMKQKFGFTLIEMLVVIAIIAVLVGIITPAVASYTTKANAATNAANLRAVKATLSTMMVSGQINYSSADDVQAAIDLIVAQQNKLDRNDIWEDIEWLALEATRFALRADIINNERRNNTYYAHSEVMSVDGTNVSAPAAKPIKVSELNLRSGTEMTATVCENEIIVTYGGIPLEIFAMIAQEGDLAKVDMSKTPHRYIDSNGDDVCDLCNGSYVHGRGEEEVGSLLDKELGNIHSCTDLDDHICDDPNCKMPVPAHYDDPADGDHICDKSGCSEPASSCTPNASCTCTDCGATSHVDEEGGSCGGGDDKCDNCGTAMS